MTERERLKEPLRTAFNMPLGELAELIRAKQEGRLIVPPCKVGDTVYHVYKGNTIVNALVADWKKEAFGDWLFRAYFSANGSSSTLLFGDNNIGETVFLTREEAEKAF